MRGEATKQEMVPAEYEVYALYYGRRDSTKAKEFLRWDIYHEPDAAQDMAYYFWLIQSKDRTILVDCGFDRTRGAANGRFQKSNPIDLLRRMGVAPSEVSYIIVTHFHYDHIGNLARFPNATVAVSKAEYDFWAGPFQHLQILQSMVLPAELELIREIDRQGRLHLVENSDELFPGIRVTSLPGHTPGLLITEVPTRSGRIILASDAIHYYEEMELDRPFRLYESLADTLRSFEILRELAHQPHTRVIAGHDPRDITNYTMVQENCFDLARPIW